MVLISCKNKLLIGATLFVIIGLASGQRKARGNSAVSEVRTPVNFDCPEEFGYYPHPSDCTQYYVCVFGGALLESCTGGLMYSHELQTCDWPRNVGCDGTEVSASGGSASAASPSQSPSSPAVVSQSRGRDRERERERERDRERLEEQQPPSPRVRYTPPPPPQPSAVVTSRGQPRNLHHNQQEIIKHQQQLYADTEDALPPAEEIESDRQQRVYRGQPSTVGQVQRDRDGLRHTNAIPTYSGRGEKIGVISFGTQNQQQQQPVRSYSEESSVAPPPQPSTVTASTRNVYNTTQYNNHYDPYNYALYEDDVELYRDVDYSHNNYNQQQTPQTTYSRGTPAPAIQSTASSDPPKRGNSVSYYPQDIYQPSTVADYNDDNSYSQVDDQTGYRQSSRQPSSRTPVTAKEIQTQAQSIINTLPPEDPGHNPSYPITQPFIQIPSDNSNRQDISTSTTTSTMRPIVTIPLKYDSIPDFTLHAPFRTAVVKKPAPFSLPQHSTTTTSTIASLTASTTTTTTTEKPQAFHFITKPPTPKSTIQSSFVKNLLSKLVGDQRSHGSVRVENISQLPIDKNHKNKLENRKVDFSTNPDKAEKKTNTSNISIDNLESSSVRSRIIIPTTYSPPKFFLKSILPKSVATLISDSINLNNRYNNSASVPKQINDSYTIRRLEDNIRKFEATNRNFDTLNKNSQQKYKDTASVEEDDQKFIDQLFDEEKFIETDGKLIENESTIIERDDKQNSNDRLTKSDYELIDSDDKLVKNDDSIYSDKSNDQERLNDENTKLNSNDDKEKLYDQSVDEKSSLPEYRLVESNEKAIKSNEQVIESNEKLKFDERLIRPDYRFSKPDRFVQKANINDKPVPKHIKTLKTVRKLLNPITVNHQLSSNGAAIPTSYESAERLVNINFDNTQTSTYEPYIINFNQNNDNNNNQKPIKSVKVKLIFNDGKLLDTEIMPTTIRYTAKPVDIITTTTTENIESTSSTPATTTTTTEKIVFSSTTTSDNYINERLLKHLERHYSTENKEPKYRFRNTVELPPPDQLDEDVEIDDKSEPDQPPNYKLKPFPKPVSPPLVNTKTVDSVQTPLNTTNAPATATARVSRVNTAIKSLIAIGGTNRRPNSKCIEKCNSDTKRSQSRGRGSAHYSGSGGSIATNEVTPTVNVNRGTPASRSRPTLKPSTSIVSKASEYIDIYRYPPRRPENIYPQPQPDKTAAKCRKDVCLLPDCSCGGKEIPGDLPVEQVPQIVLLTFDDSVNDLNKGLYSDLFEKGRTNPNGCPIAATFYVSHEWTDYSQVQNLYSDGHEIASHTVSHSFGEQFSQKKWTREVAGQREILSAYGGVHLKDVRGMRAPFLSVGGNKMFKMLYDSNFTYDSSMPIYENKPPSWPYTLDYKLFHDCMIPPCPTRSYPGVWEVPMVMWQDLNGGRCSMGDACSNPSDPEGVFKMLMKNFQRHYTTNRAPFGLFYHAAWFTQPHHKEGFIQFIDTILSMKDVWMVTNWQAIQWVRDPTPTSRLNSFQPFQCDYSNRPKRCNNPKVCNLWHKSGVRYMKTCQPCPDIYPWTGNTGIRSSRIDNDIED